MVPSKGNYSIDAIGIVTTAMRNSVRSEAGKATSLNETYSVV